MLPAGIFSPLFKAYSCLFLKLYIQIKLQRLTKNIIVSVTMKMI